MLRIGADPEVFLRDRSTRDFVSAHDIFPGTKKNPHKVDKGAVQVDGFAFEFNIDPAETEREFVTNIEVVLEQMREMIRNKAPNLEMAFVPFAAFDPMYFMLQDLTPKILGCDPDFDEFGNEKVPPDGMQDRPFRTAAGHVHIGFTKDQDPFGTDHFENCKLIAREFKNVEGFLPITTDETRRTQYYGMPGSFRPKSYGVELRSPSNLWVETPEGRSKMFRTVYTKMMELGHRYNMGGK
jgi:hypothetical protein